jgi:hypothetical protein
MVQPVLQLRILAGKEAFNGCADTAVRLTDEFSETVLEIFSQVALVGQTDI